MGEMQCWNQHDQSAGKLAEDCMRTAALVLKQVQPRVRGDAIFRESAKYADFLMHKLHVFEMAPTASSCRHHLGSGVDAPSALAAGRELSWQGQP